MQTKRHLLVRSILGILCGSILIFWTLVAGKPISHNVVTSSMQLNPAFPIRLEIPKIGVDAPIEDVGTTSDGAMAVPQGPIDVAWFDLGPRPGKIGSAVIAGHEGWKDGIAAVFDNLHELQKGDKIYVVNASGATTIFVVVRTQLYGQYENDSPIFVSHDGLAHLNLITCEGVWNAAEKSYSNRLVVFADKI